MYVLNGDQEGGENMYFSNGKVSYRANYYYESRKAPKIDFSIRWHVLNFFMYNFLEGPMHFIFPFSSDFCKYDSVSECVLSSIN